ASAEQLAAAGPRPRVGYRVAAAERRGLDTASAGLITVAQALHWFDLDAFYREADRVLRPGAVLAAWTYGLLTVEPPEANVVVERFYRMLDPWWPPERALVDDGYRSIPFPFDALPAPPFEIRAQWSLTQLAGYVRTWSAVARYRRDRGADPVVRLEEELRPLWGEPRGTRLVVWPLALKVGRRRAGDVCRR